MARAGLLALLGALSISLASRVVAQDAAAPPKPAGSEAPESAGPEFRSATEQQQLDLLRKLLGVEAPVPEAAPAPAPAPTEVEAPAPGEAEAPEPTPVAAPEPAPAPKPAVEAKPEPKPAPKPVVQPRPAPKPAPRPVVQPKPAPRPAPKPVVKPTPKPAPKPAPQAVPKVAPKPVPKTPEAVEAAAPRVPEKAPEPTVYEVLGISEKDLPAPGTVVDGSNAERWTHLLTPSLRWALRRGARMHIVEPKRIVPEPARAEATERYHAQVQLGPNKKSLVNYVAGAPFPYATETDPDAALKLMFNFEMRLIIDDVDGRDFSCTTGSMHENHGVQVEREYRIGHFRRLYHTGRLYVDPKPAWPTPDGIRYRETLSPINEPFDLKGAGFTYNRYLDPARQDDSWLYFPQMRRVRRLSTAQRSEGVFGQDVDLDSYAGFAGNPAWFDWQLLGKKTLLAPFHARNQPAQWSPPPAEFFFEENWEPREMYILAARSLLPEYNFSLRILYLDVQSHLIPYTEVYDHDGQLWRAYVQQWKAGLNKGMPGAKDSALPFETAFVQALTVYDMQQEHTTFCSFPSLDAPSDDVWFYWRGDRGGSRPEDFDVANFIQTGR